MESIWYLSLQTLEVVTTTTEPEHTQLRPVPSIPPNALPTVMTPPSRQMPSPHRPFLLLHCIGLALSTKDYAGVRNVFSLGDAVGNAFVCQANEAKSRTGACATF